MNHINLLKTTISVIILFSTATAFAQRLDRFGSSANETINGFTRPVPYIDVKSYYGYIKPGTQADEVRDGKSFFYLYLYIQDSLSELGIRLITPVPDLSSPDRRDFVSENYYDFEKEKENTFDSWIALEHSEEKISMGGGQKKMQSSWTQLAYNDDGNEVPNKSNSVVRTGTKKKPVPPGLYRIAFTATKNGKVKGGFLMQVGSTVTLTGVKLTTSEADIYK